jgi:hypothetical protein
MKYCKQCNDKIPYRLIIDGKIRNTQNRKFCIKCSPFGSHNTKASLTQIAHKPLINNKRPYKEWSEDAKNENRARIYWRGRYRKKQLVELKGGKCQNCGYNRCLGVLTFHHINPKTKTMNLTTKVMQTESWKKILEEVKQCELLCFNCHMEKEHVDDLDLKYADFAERFYKRPREDSNL